MKKLLHILLPVLLLAAACGPETLPNYTRFKGSAVEVGTDNALSEETSHLLILNESVYPDYSTIDMLDFQSGLYYSDLFWQANYRILQTLGPEVSDMAVVYGQLWVAMYLSCQIAVLDLPSFSLIEYIPVEYPRQLVVEGPYVYASSYGISSTEDVSAAGKVYRINAATRKKESLYVGAQPEGMAVLGEKLYIADSGHLKQPHSKLISVINLKTFKSEKMVELPATHPNQVIARGGRLWVNTLGESEVSAEYEGEEPPLISPHCLIRMGVNGYGRVIDGVHAEKMVLDQRTLYLYGNAAELQGGAEWHLYKVDADGDEVIDIPFEGTDLSRVTNPTALQVHPENGDLYLADTDSNGNSRLFCFDKDLRFKWSIPTGFNTTRLLFW